MTTKQHIAIVGGGVAGLASAIFLGQLGHRVTVFEKFEQPQAVGAGILLQPTGQIVLQRLGLLESMKNQSSKIDGLVGHNEKGKLIMDIHYADQWPDSFGLGVHRANLFRLLWDMAIEMNIEIEAGVCVEDIEKLTGNLVRLNSNTGSTLGEFNATIIANGTQSDLRRCIGVRQKCTPYPWGALWAICNDKDNQFTLQLVQRYHGVSKMIGVLPTGVHPDNGADCVSFFWSMRSDQYSKWLESNFDHWKESVLDHWPELACLVEKFNQHDALTFANYGDVVMQKWNHDNLVCIGDAAHGMSPQLGQGTNLALIDAMVLAQCVEESNDLASAFDDYSSKRKRHLSFYTLASRGLTPFFQSNSIIASWLRDLTFPWLSRVPFAYKQSLRTIAGIKTGVLFDKSLIEL